jgi:hypothetical protein
MASSHADRGCVGDHRQTQRTPLNCDFPLRLRLTHEAGVSVVLCGIVPASGTSAANCYQREIRHILVLRRYSLQLRECLKRRPPLEQCHERLERDRGRRQRPTRTDAQGRQRRKCRQWRARGLPSAGSILPRHRHRPFSVEPPVDPSKPPNVVIAQPPQPPPAQADLLVPEKVPFIPDSDQAAIRMAHHSQRP